MDSHQIAQILRNRGFKDLSAPNRTKAHGYKHALMSHPVYVKIGGKSGALTPARNFALVLHPEDGAAVAQRDLPAGVKIANDPYKNAGLVEYRNRDASTNWGRDVDIEDEVAFDGLLILLGVHRR